MIDWLKYPDFQEHELACKCGCGKSGVTVELMNKLQGLRTVYGKPMKVTSGYRCPDHPDEAKKTRPGAHAQGTAADIRTVTGTEKYELKKLAFQMGFVGIGDAKTFTHLDVGHDTANRPANWSY